MAIQNQNQTSNTPNPFRGNAKDLDKESQQFAGTQGGISDDEEVDVPVTGDGDIGLGSQTQTKQKENLGGNLP